jgi:tripartite-type tricarboxylate transporter receptor subunit TctC
LKIVRFISTEGQSLNVNKKKHLKNMTNLIQEMNKNKNAVRVL